MGKLIRSEVLLDQIDSPYTEYPVIKQIRKAIREMIEEAPAVDAEPVRHGRWIKVENDYNSHLYECSYCHTWTSLPTEEVNDGNIRYCWSCGAKMYGGKDGKE